MIRSGHNDEWIFRSSRERLIVELGRRNLPVDGSDSVLALRLLRHERTTRDLGAGAIDGAKEMSDTEHLELPAGDAVCPDSPFGITMDPRMGAGSAGSPRGNGPRVPYESGSSSASAVYNIMRKWNLKFSGARGEDAETFLIRIEEGRELIPVADEDVLRCIPFFLTGIALHWFRGKRARLNTWAAFKTAWRARFGDPDFQFALRDEIMRRTQGERESVGDYLTCLSALFDRLSPPWCEAEKVSYAHRNMLPRLQTMVHRDAIDDLETLELLAARAESCCRAAQSYRAPPPPERSLFPDLAYRPPKASNKHHVGLTTDALAALNLSTGEAGEKGPAPKGKKARARDSGTAGQAAGAIVAAPGTPGVSASTARDTRVGSKCWNCEQAGHFARDCKSAPRMHCYRCGKGEVTLRTCPECTGNE